MLGCLGMVRQMARPLRDTRKMLCRDVGRVELS